MNLLAALLGLAYAVLLIFFVLLGLMHVATSHCGRILGGRGLAVLLGGGLLMASLWGFDNSSEQLSVAQVDSQGANPTDFALVSTEEMWEHLSRPRIVLTGNAKASSGDAVVNDDHGEIGKKEISRKVELSQLEKTEPAKPNVEARPSWVDNPRKHVGNVYRVVVSAGPYKTAAECYQNLEPQLSKEVQLRIEQLVPGSRLVGHEGSAGVVNYGVDHGDDLEQWAETGKLVDLGQLGIAMEYIWREIRTEEWVETTVASFGEMKQVHVLMQFGATQDQELMQAYRNYQRRGRIAGVGTSAGAIVAGLLLLYGLLHADTMTRGYYSKRLFFGVPAAIIGLVLLFIA